MKLTKKSTFSKDKIPDVKSLYRCMKENASNALDKLANGIDLAIVSKSKTNTPTVNVLIAAIIWFSVIDERNNPTAINAPVNKKTPKIFPSKLPKLGTVKKDTIAM